MNFEDPYERLRFGRKRLKEGTKELMFSELSSLLASGLDFSRSFELLIAGERDAKTGRLFEALFASVVQGNPLWTAFDRSGCFSALDCGVLRIGEETGRLVYALSFLNDYYHKKAEHRKMLVSAVSYPAIVLFTAMVVVSFMILVIVPMFEQVYIRMGGALPALTSWVIGVSGKFPYYLVLGAGTALMTGGLLWRFRHNDRLRERKAALLLKLPVVGSILRKNCQSQFCKLLYLLTGSGIPLLQGLDMLPEIITFYPYQRSFGEISEHLGRGESFADNLAKYPLLYDVRLTTLIRVGEETNRLPEMLCKQGTDLNQELEYRFRQLGNVLEPLLILIVGVLVAVILIAMYLPMFHLGGVMSS